MQNLLIVVDMQRDFIDGALGTPEARAILPHVVRKMQGHSGRILATRDTHETDYLDTQEGRLLPMPHCIRGTEGWQLHPDIAAHLTEPPLDKPVFGSAQLGVQLARENEANPIDRITLVGLCTDICVISNALLLRAFLPETEIVVDAACCAGVSPHSHRIALEAMKACQIRIENE
ncbi:MAG: cysteine hydrolase [Clostridiales bacterium]|nr:cysteine hydrolase [Clostridiales bacterium]